MAMKQVERLTALAPKLRRRWRRYLIDGALAAGGVALATALIIATNFYPRVPTISLVYLLVVLALAGTRGVYPAILASLLAFVSYDFFFITPHYTFIIPTVEDFITLVVLLAAAIITSQLAAAARRAGPAPRARITVAVRKSPGTGCPARTAAPGARIARFRFAGVVWD